MIFTLRNVEDEIRRVLDAGARGYVFKSEPDEQIVKAIEAIARRRAFFSSDLSEALFGNFVEHQALNNNHSTALTTREREVVRLIAEGKSNKGIAYLLDISIKTVETHRSASMRKVNVHSTAQLVRYANHSHRERSLWMQRRSAKNRHSKARTHAETKIRELSGRKSRLERSVWRRTGNVRFARAGWWR
jgi:DNA-binding NarL/FixJ family response regulator